MQTDVYNLNNEAVGKASLPEELFGAKWSPELVKQVLLAEQANRHHAYAHAKGRGEVRGGGKKPWRQKGTGRARHGSIRSPIWRKGGKAHGPLKERDYTQKVNKKMKRQALACVLSEKMREGNLKVVTTLVAETPKTKAFADTLRALLTLKKNTKRMNVLLVPFMEEKNIFRAARNLPSTKILRAASLNIEDIMKHKNFFIDERAISELAPHAARKKAL